MEMYHRWYKHQTTVTNFWPKPNKKPTLNTLLVNFCLKAKYKAAKTGVLELKYVVCCK